MVAKKAVQMAVWKADWWAASKDSCWVVHLVASKVAMTAASRAGRRAER